MLNLYAFHVDLEKHSRPQAYSIRPRSGHLTYSLFTITSYFPKIGPILSKSEA